MNKNHSFPIAQDKNLSLEAIGLYLLIESCIDEPVFDYDHYKPVLMARCKESSDAFNSAWEELKKAGYLKQPRIPHGDSESKGFHYEYELLATADDSTSSCETLITCGRTE